MRHVEKTTELIAFVFISSLCCGSTENMERLVAAVVVVFLSVMFCSKFGEIIKYFFAVVVLVVAHSLLFFLSF